MFILYEPAIKLNIDDLKSILNLLLTEKKGILKKKRQRERERERN